METDWISLIPSIVYSRIISDFSEKVKTDYKMTDENFSTESNSKSPSVFPFVYVNELPSAERGQDIDGTTINGGLFTFQIDVYDNQSRQRVRTVMNEVVRIMKSMRFNISAMPNFDDTDGTYRRTMRCQRIIGQGDTL